MIRSLLLATGLLYCVAVLSTLPFSAGTSCSRQVVAPSTITGFDMEQATRGTALATSWCGSTFRVTSTHYNFEAGRSNETRHDWLWPESHCPRQPLQPAQKLT